MTLGNNSLCSLQGFPFHFRTVSFKPIQVVEWLERYTGLALDIPPETVAPEPEQQQVFFVFAKRSSGQR